MVKRNVKPKILPGSMVMPPMDIDVPTQKQLKKLPEKLKNSKRKTVGRFASLNSFVDDTMRLLNKSSTKVWLILYRDEREGISRSSQADIARRAGISDRSVRKAIQQLKSLGLLKVVSKGGLNRGPSRYRIAPTKKS